MNDAVKIAAQSREARAYMKTTGKNPLVRIVEDFTKPIPTNKFEAGKIQIDEAKKNGKKALKKAETFRTVTPPMSTDRDSLDFLVENYTCWVPFGSENPNFGIGAYNRERIRSSVVDAPSGYYNGPVCVNNDVDMDRHCTVCAEKTRHTQKTSLSCGFHCTTWLKNNPSVIHIVRERISGSGMTSTDIGEFLLDKELMWGRDNASKTGQKVYWLPTEKLVTGELKYSWCWKDAKTDSENWKRVCKNTFGLVTNIRANRFKTTASLRAKGANTYPSRETSVDAVHMKADKSRDQEVRVCAITSHACYMLYKLSFFFLLSKQELLLDHVLSNAETFAHRVDQLKEGLKSHLISKIVEIYNTNHKLNKLVRPNNHDMYCVTVRLFILLFIIQQQNPNPVVPGEEKSESQEPQGKNTKDVIYVGQWHNVNRSHMCIMIHRYIRNMSPTLRSCTDGVYSRKNIPLHPSTVRRVLNAHFAYLSYGRTTDLGVCMECEDYKAREAYWKSIGSGTDKVMEWLQAAKLDFIDFKAGYKQHNEEHRAERAGLDARIDECNKNPSKIILLTMDYTKAKRALQSMSGTKVRIRSMQAISDEHI